MPVNPGKAWRGGTGWGGEVWGLAVIKRSSICQYVEFHRYEDFCFLAGINEVHIAQTPGFASCLKRRKRMIIAVPLFIVPFLHRREYKPGEMVHAVHRVTVAVYPVRQVTCKMNEPVVRTGACPGPV